MITIKDDLKYPFGFLLTREKFNNKYNWHEFSINEELTLYYSNSNEFFELQYNKSQIIVLGYFFDIRNGDLSKNAIIKNLIMSRQSNYNDFLENLSYLSGRFLLILNANEEIRLFHDVAGLKAVCYYKGKGRLVIGSHDTLINEAMEHKLKKLYNNPKEVSFSSHTRFESVEKLIPNMSLEITTAKIERYYPVGKYSVRSKEEIRRELISYLNETVKWLNKSNYKLLLSLTGGGDSKMSLAILKPLIHRLETFTYLKDTTNESNFVKKTFQNDKEIVDSIVNNLNLNHKFIEISSDESTDLSVIETIKHNVFSNHHYNLANDYYRIYGGENYLHIRSSALFNIGKYIFPFESINVEDWDVETIAKYVQKWTNIEDEADNNKHVSNLLDYAQLENFYNYNPLELLFLSYRLIQWHGGVVGESDIAFDTILLLNARKIVDLILSYPIEDRHKNKLFVELIDQLWPILNYWDINSPNNLQSKYLSTASQLKKYKKINSNLSGLSELGLKLIKTSSTQPERIYQKITNGGFLFKFSNNNIKKKESYELYINFLNYDVREGLQFKLRFYYNNPNGRDKITVKSNLFKKPRDIIDLYGEHVFQIDKLSEQKDLYINIEHHSPSSLASWVNASRLWIGDFKFVN